MLLVYEEFPTKAESAMMVRFLRLISLAGPVEKMVVRSSL